MLYVIHYACPGRLIPRLDLNPVIHLHNASMASTNLPIRVITNVNHPVLPEHSGARTGTDLHASVRALHPWSPKQDTDLHAVHRRHLHMHNLIHKKRVLLFNQNNILVYCFDGQETDTWSYFRKWSELLEINEESKRDCDSYSDYSMSCFDPNSSVDRIIS